jgi:hypothetical protein
MSSRHTFTFRKEKSMHVFIMGEENYEGIDLYESVLVGDLPPNFNASRLLAHYLELTEVMMANQKLRDDATNVLQQYPILLATVDTVKLAPNYKRKQVAIETFAHWLAATYGLRFLLYDKLTA